MEMVRYADFSLGLHQRVSAQRVPISGTIEVTRRCPLKCVHCYNNLPMRDPEAQLHELTYKEHCRIIDEIIEAGCLWLLYTGGEIFARKDFLDIYTYAKQKGLLITLFTNGTLMTPRLADYLAEWHPFSVEITLYGRTKETYERITGIPGSYERCLRGIQLLKSRGIPLKLKTMALTINKHEVWEIKRFAEEDLGLGFRFDPMVNARIDCSQSPLNVRLTPREVVELDVLDPKRMQEWRDFAAQFNNPVLSADKCDDLYQCGGGIGAFAIDACGGLSTCVLAGRNKYDLRTGNFQDGWENFLFRLRKKKMGRKTKCTACGMKAMCGMCPVNAELENQDAEEPVDFLCQVAHLRAKALGFPVKPHGECEYCRTEG